MSEKKRQKKDGRDKNKKNQPMRESQKQDSTAGSKKTTGDKPQTAQGSR